MGLNFNASSLCLICVLCAYKSQNLCSNSRGLQKKLAGQKDTGIELVQIICALCALMSQNLCSIPFPLFGKQF